MNVFKKILYNIEPLEFNLKEQVNKSKYKFFTILYIFCIKLFRIIYKTYQRIFLKPSTRLILQNIEKAFLPKKNYKNAENLLQIDKAQELHSAGYVGIESIFTENELDETVTFLSKDHLLEPIYSEHKNFYLKSPPKGVKTGYLPTQTLIDSKYILKAVNNTDLLDLLKNYFGCSFKLDWIWGWWSFPSEDLAGPQQCHRDYESMNFVKVFVYLTDVDQENGPHEYIKGSHKINKLYDRKRFSNETIKENFIQDKRLSILGKKGTTFIANTFGIHKGLNPQKNKRLVLVYLFSVIPSNRSPKIPPLCFSEIKNDQNKYLENKDIFDLFINFKK